MQDHRSGAGDFLDLGLAGVGFPSVATLDGIDVNTIEPTDGRQHHAAIPMLLAVVSSVAGALVARSLETSQSLALFGAAVGAAIPPLLAVVGPFTHLRLAVGVLITVIALVVTYASFTVSEKALGKGGTTFPVPGPAPETTRTVTSPATTTGSQTAGTTCEGQLCISWSPKRLHCSSDPCEPDVTVRSEGSTVLLVTGLVFTGDVGSRLSQEGDCIDADLQRDETCSIRVHVKPGEAGSAQLRIQQNLKGPASIIDLEVDAITPTTPADLDLSLSAPRGCSVIPGGAISGADNLTIFVAILKSGNGKLLQLVPYTLTSDTGLNGGASSGVSTGSSSTPMQVDLGPDDYGQSHSFTVTIDPKNEIAEQDETNNTLPVTVSLPARPDQTENVPCTTP
jgi:hypothetical protein